MRRTLPLWTLFLLLFAPLLSGQTVVGPAGDGSYRITGETYQALIAPDGCMTNLKVLDRELLNNTFTISRGSYFFQGGVQKLESLSRSGSVVAAENERVKLEYRPSSDSMTLRMTNLTEERMSFFLILDASLDAVQSGDAALVRLPVDVSIQRSVWFLGDSRLEITGSDKLWDWSGSGNNVWEILLDGGATREAELKMGKASAEELAAIAKLPLPPPLLGEWPDTDLVVLSPRNYQVFQRRKHNQGFVRISGKKRGSDPLQAEITGPGLKVEGLTIPCDERTGQFNQDLSLPAGGWYRLELRCGEAVQVIEPFGIGEVFVTAGQSNSTNCGQFPTTQTSGMVSAFNGLSWQPGDDPFWGPHDMTRGGSPWPGFGDAMYAKYQVPIGVAVTGHGGTSVNQWQPGKYETPAEVNGAELFHWMMVRIHQLGPRGFRAVLWHQGESDCAGETTDSYVEKMTRVIRASNEAAGWAFPWFVAQVSYHNPDAPKHDNIRDAHATLWKQGVALEGPDTDTLVGDDRDYDGRGIHFSVKGLKKHGELWAEKVIPWLDDQLQQ